jgi:hypothetical protein
MTIVEHAERCIGQFDTLLHVGDEAQSSSKAAQIKINKVRVEDQFARFRMWAGNIGVFAQDHASLDYRLRESTKGKSVMLGLLETLCEFLQSGTILPLHPCLVLIMCFRSYRGTPTIAKLCERTIRYCLAA